MKSKIFLTIFLTISLLLSAGKVHAEEKPIEEFTVIEEEDISRLTVEETKQPFAKALTPPPAPTPPAEKGEEGENDNRSWTKFTYKKIIAEVAQRYDIDPQVIYATIMTESEGNEYAFRYEPAIKDASLCMGQILISTARRLGFEGEPKEMYKPEICIDLIGKYHRAMLDTYGELTPIQLATAYNAGSPYKRAVPGHIFRFDMWYNEQG